MAGRVTPCAAGFDFNRRRARSGAPCLFCLKFCAALGFQPTHSLQSTANLPQATVSALVSQTPATERLFTYTYEPETLPKGAVEFEQWVTLRSGRTGAVGKENYRRVQFREEIEYGVTDNYQLSLYFNHQYEHFKNPATGASRTDYRQKGISIENKLMVWNPADHDVGLSLYVEPTYDGEEFKLEQKIILGQRVGDWKWALNLSHETEWSDDFSDKVGEFEITFGAARTGFALVARIGSAPPR